MTEEKPTGLAPDNLVVVHQNSIHELRLALREALSAVPSADSLKDAYSSQADREKITRRLMLNTAHNFLIEHILRDPAREDFSDGSVNVTVHLDHGGDAFGNLSAAMRDFAHDAKRLDEGKKAELILKAIDQDGDENSELISADRLVLLLALLYIKLNTSQITEIEKCNAASSISGFEAATLRTSIRDMRKSIIWYKTSDVRNGSKFSKTECDYYTNTLKKMKALSTRPDALSRADINSPSEFLEPILFGLASKTRAIRPMRQKR